MKIFCIILTAAGLVLIAKESKKQVNYKKIAIPLVLYLSSRLIYGFVMRSAEGYISSTMTLFWALVILALLMLPSAKPHKMPKESPEGLKGMAIVLGCKLPNAVGLLLENRIAAESLTNFSFIHPMILVVMFVTGFFNRTEKYTKYSIAGGLCVIAGIFGFQAV